MTILHLFQPGSLIIWVPGLALLFTMFHTYSRIKSGTATQQVKLTCIGLFIVSLILLFYVPQHEIGKAIEFANAYNESGETVTAYPDIDFDTKNAWRMTAMSEEEKADFLSYSGTEDRGPVIVDGDELVYTPQHMLAWCMLLLLFIGSALVFFQDVKTFVSRSGS